MVGLQWLLTILLLGLVTSAPRLAHEYDWSARLTAGSRDENLSRNWDIQTSNSPQLHDSRISEKENDMPILLEDMAIENQNPQSTQDHEIQGTDVLVLDENLLQDQRNRESENPINIKTELEVRVASLLESVKDGNLTDILPTNTSPSTVSADQVVDILNKIIQKQRDLNNTSKRNGSDAIDVFTITPIHVESLEPATEIKDDLVFVDISQETPSEGNLADAQLNNVHSPVGAVGSKSETRPTEDGFVIGDISHEPTLEEIIEDTSQVKGAKNKNIITSDVLDEIESKDITNDANLYDIPDTNVDSDEVFENFTSNGSVNILSSNERTQPLEAIDEILKESESKETENAINDSLETFTKSEDTTNGEEATKTDVPSPPKIIRIVEIKNQTLENPGILNQATNSRTGRKIRGRRTQVTGRGKALRDYSSGVGNREINYSVVDSNSKQVYGHQATYLQTEQHGTYFVHFSDGTLLLVTYTADINGYQPILRYFKSLDEMNYHFATNTNQVNFQSRPGVQKPFGTFGNNLNRPNAFKPPHKVSPSRRPALQFATISTNDGNALITNDITTKGPDDIRTTEVTPTSQENDNKLDDEFSSTEIQISTPSAPGMTDTPFQDTEIVTTSFESLTPQPTLNPDDIGTTFEPLENTERFSETTETVDSTEEETLMDDSEDLTTIDSLITESTNLSTDETDLTTDNSDVNEGQTLPDVHYDDIIQLELTTQQDSSLDSSKDCSEFEDDLSCSEKVEFKTTITDNADVTTVPSITEQDSESDLSGDSDVAPEDALSDDDASPPEDNITDSSTTETETTTIAYEDLAETTPFLGGENLNTDNDLQENSTDSVLLATDYFDDDEIMTITEGDATDSSESNDADNEKMKSSREVDQVPDFSLDTDNILDSTTSLIPADLDTKEGDDEMNITEDLFTTEISSLEEITTANPQTDVDNDSIKDSEEQKENEIVQIIPPPSPSEQALLLALMPKHLKLNGGWGSNLSLNSLDSPIKEQKNDTSLVQSVNVTPIIPYGNLTPEYITFAVFPSQEPNTINSEKTPEILVFHLQNTSLILTPDSSTNNTKQDLSENGNSEVEENTTDISMATTTSSGKDSSGRAYFQNTQPRPNPTKLPFLSTKRLRPRPFTQNAQSKSSIPSEPDLGYQRELGRFLARPTFSLDNSLPSSKPSERDERLYRFWLNRRRSLSLPNGGLKSPSQRSRRG